MHWHPGACTPVCDALVFPRRKDKGAGLLRSQVEVRGVVSLTGLWGQTTRRGREGDPDTDMGA